jgi:hypothetical protein
MNAQWDDAYQQDMALFMDDIGEDREQSDAGPADMSNWGDADASQDTGGYNDENGNTSDTMVIDPANKFVDEDKAFIDRLFFDEPTVMQSKGDDGEGDAFASNTETAPVDDGSEAMESHIVQGPGVVKTHTTKPTRAKYVIKCPIKRALVMKKNREAAQTSRDLIKARDIALNTEVAFLRVTCDKLSAFKTGALAYIRDNNEKADLLACLQALHAANLV